eukprot:52800_1
MELLKQIDELITTIDGTNVHFNMLDLEDNILFHVLGFLIDEAPLEDSLVLTCSKFRWYTYNHPIKFPKHYHVRVDPLFRFSKARIKDDTMFQIGCSIAPATKQAVVINNINGITNNQIFPFQNMRVFQFTTPCSLSTVHPIFHSLRSSFRYLSFASCKFMSQNASTDDDTKMDIDFPPVFDNCLLFTFVLYYARTWNQSITFEGKFPQLTSLKVSIENIQIIPQLQCFLDSVSSTVSMLFVELNIRARDYPQMPGDDPLFTLRLPPKLEILSIYCAEDVNYNVDLSACHDLKYVVSLQASIKFIHHAMETHSDTLSKLAYLVVNDLNDVYKLKWDLVKANGVRTVYLPSLPGFSKTIQGSGDIELFGCFPNVNTVRNDIENTKLRLLLRELNNQQKRHYLWGYFWYEARDKLKSEETELIKQDSAH